MKKSVVLFLLALACFSARGQSTPAIIPVPVSVQHGTGTFTLSPETVITHSGEATQPVAQHLKEMLSSATGYSLALGGKKKGAAIALERVASLPAVNNRHEGYTLNITAQGATIRATDPAGLFYGVQTLLQLLPPKPAGATLKLPMLSIADFPRFPYRGLMLDVSRHFYGVADVKRFIDLMSRYKFNMFHWHLTDDQGWRIEIKKYPRLTSVGAWRVPRTGYWWLREPPRPGEAATYGGFYTQDEIKEVVAYARARHIDVLPEIDVPGHSMAALAAYPELSSAGGAYAVNPGSKFYTAIDNALCPCKDFTYTFLEDVFAEIAPLFPYPYIHIGGDECYKGFWKDQPLCRQLMASEKIASLEELQSHFIKRVEKILARQGKKLIGWDEILEGGLAPDATVMSWRGMDGGIAAARARHSVIMTPTQHCYLDLYQGDPEAEPPTYSNLRLKDCYAFEPVPEGVDAALVLGGQGNAWTEFMPNYRHVEYMVWPRSFALAEVLWSAKASRTWPDFISRMETHLQRFDSLAINHSRSFYDPAFTFTKTADGKPLITLATELDNLEIHYSTDNTFPDRFATRYTTPFVLPEGANNLLVVTYRNGKAMGKMIRITTEEILARLAGKKLGY